MSEQIDYSKCSNDELYDVYEHIDKDNYPERTQKVLDEIEVRGLASPLKPIVLPQSSQEELPPLEITKTKIFGALMVIVFSGGSLVWDFYNGYMSNRNGVIVQSDEPIQFMIAAIIRIGFVVYFIDLILSERKKDT